jgi:hypothetical protein
MKDTSGATAEVVELRRELAAAKERQAELEKDLRENDNVWASRLCRQYEENMRLHNTAGTLASALLALKARVAGDDAAMIDKALAEAEDG